MRPRPKALVSSSLGVPFADNGNGASAAAKEDLEKECNQKREYDMLMVEDQAGVPFVPKNLESLMVRLVFGCFIGIIVIVIIRIIYFYCLFIYSIYLCLSIT